MDLFHLSLLLLLPLALCFPSSVDDNVIYQFPENYTFMSSIAVRSRTGNLLFTTSKPNARVYEVRGVQGHDTCTHLVWEFNDMTGLLGITETHEDTFVVAGGLLNDTTFQPVPGTASLWTFSYMVSDQWFIYPPVINVPLPANTFPNSITSIPSHKDIVLVGDSLGSILRANLTSGDVETVANTTGMSVVPGSPLPMGVNGIAIHGGYLYWSNSFKSEIWKMKISEDGYPQNGTETMIAKIPHTFLDDIVVDGRGHIYAATNPNNTIVTVSPDGHFTGILIGGETDSVVMGASSLAFGQTASDRDKLFVVTSGGKTAPINGTYLEPAKIVRVTTHDDFFHH